MRKTIADCSVVQLGATAQNMQKLAQYVTGQNAASASTASTASGAASPP